MKKRKKEQELPIDSVEPTPEASAQDEKKPTKALPPLSLPVSDATAAGLIAAVFAVIGAVIALKAATQDKEPKPKKPKKAKPTKAA